MVILKRWASPGWTLVLEHAVAQLYNWEGIRSNNAKFAWRTLTNRHDYNTFSYDYAKGQRDLYYRLQVYTAIETAFASGQGIYFSTKDTFGPNAVKAIYLQNGGKIYGDHAYTVVAVNGGLITLNNPWGIDRTIQITINEMHEVLETYYTLGPLE